MALQAPFLHAASTSSGGNSLFPSQHINNLNYIRNDSIQSASSNSSSSTTLTPLVNARVHPHNPVAHEGLNPPQQYLTSTLQQPSSQQHNAQHVQYAQGLHAVLQQVGQIVMDIAPLIIQFSQHCMLARSCDTTIWNVILTLIYIAAATTFGFTNITRGTGVPK